MDGSNERDDGDTISVPYPPRKKKMITCICRAHRDGCIPDNCSNDRIFAYGWGIANNVVDVKRGAEKMVKDLLGAKSTHHIQCRCTDGKGGKVISH